MTIPKNHVSLLFQVATFLGATVLLTVLFYPALLFFKSYEQLPELIPYTPSTSAIPINTGLTIHHFIESNIVKNELDLDATVWFAYDPQKVKREDIAQFAFDRAAIEKSPARYILQKNKEIALYDIQMHCKMDFDFHEYPLDEHRLWFSLKNNQLAAEKYQFVANVESFTLDKHAEINNCKAENKKVQTGYMLNNINLPAETQETKDSRVIYSIDCDPIDLRHFLNIFLPLYFIFFLTLFSFSFVYSEHATDVPGIAAAGVPALFAYRFVIESIAPNVNYFMLSDYLFFLYLILSLITFLLVAWALNKPVYVKKLIILALYTSMLVGCAAIMYAM